MIDVIVGAALVLTGIYLCWWIASRGLRERIEKPKHEFLRRVREFDRTGEHP